MNGFEIVHTMTDFYDGPRGGIADFRGRPHIYESQWEDDDYSDVFLLSLVDEELLRLAIEDWEIWLRWEAAFHSGSATLETHPALPEDRVRHEELTRLLGQKLVVDLMSAIKASAEFRVRENTNAPTKGFKPLEVRWAVLPQKDG